MNETKNKFINGYASSISSSAFFNGSISLEQDSAYEILMPFGSVALDSTQISDNKVTVLGRIFFSAVYINESGEINCINNFTDFSHTVDCDDVKQQEPCQCSSKPR